MSDLPLKELYLWCSIPAETLASHPGAKVPLTVLETPEELALAMARELADTVKAGVAAGRPTRAIVPCGPTGWYPTWVKLVNEERISLKDLHVFHMDECLDWQGRPLPEAHPWNFRSVMERHFYGGVDPALAVPEAQRHWLYPWTTEAVRKAVYAAPIDLTMGGWGMDGHIAYNQSPRHPYTALTVEEIANSTIRVQENNWDTILAIAQRTFGSAYQFVPPMSVTLGMKECLMARKVRLYADTGAWKQTALRVALFGPVTKEYPMTLLQKHPDARLTVTRATAKHPISEHPEWVLF